MRCCSVKASLKEHGALLVRSGATLEEFEQLSDQLITPMVHHSTSTSVERDVVNVDRTTSTVNKGMDYIPLHREGSYAPGCPDLLMLYCVRPADAGGETTLCDGVDLLAALPARIREFVEHAIVRWKWSATPERWMATLGVSSKNKPQPRWRKSIYDLRLMKNSRRALMATRWKASFKRFV